MSSLWAIDGWLRTLRPFRVIDVLVAQKPNRNLFRSTNSIKTSPTRSTCACWSSSRILDTPNSRTTGKYNSPDQIAMRCQTCYPMKSPVIKLLHGCISEAAGRSTSSKTRHGEVTGSLHAVAFSFEAITSSSCGLRRRYSFTHHILQYQIFHNNTWTMAGSQGRRSNSLPTEVVDYLKAWLLSPEHIMHPYPTEQGEFAQSLKRMQWSRLLLVTQTPFSL